MYILKGFMVISPLADNTVNVIAPLGELSTQSYTYAKEKGQYTNPSYKDVVLTTFRSKSVEEETETLVVVPIVHQNAALQIGQWLYTKAELGELNSNYQRCQELLQAQFGSLVSNIKVGQMQTDRTRWLPEWVSYTLTGSDNEVKFWFSDTAFQDQYDEYEIEFVPALEPLDSFFNDPLVVQAALAARSMTAIFNRIEEVKNKQPYTSLLNQEFEYRGGPIGENRLMTNWTVMIWGVAGNNPDIIKEELAEYILGNTQHTEEEWIKIFPDIFTNTEFILIPFWDQYAIPNRTIVTGMYSPSTHLLSALSLAYAAVEGKGYYREHVQQNLVLSSVLYKSLAFAAVGGPYNRDGIYRLDMKWEDYLIVPTTSPDFNRMDIKTQEWITLFYEMLIVAENATPTSSIPRGMSRVIRNGVMYIAASFERVLYLVLTRYTVQEIETSPERFPWVPERGLILTDSTDTLYMIDQEENLLSRMVVTDDPLATA